MQIIKESYSRILAVVFVMAFSITACEPVIAIGWREIFIVLGLFVFLFGPPLYRFIRKVEKFMKHEKKDK